MKSHPLFSLIDWDHFYLQFLVLSEGGVHSRIIVDPFGFNGSRHKALPPGLTARAPSFPPYPSVPLNRRCRLISRCPFYIVPALSDVSAISVSPTLSVVPPLIFRSALSGVSTLLSIVPALSGVFETFPRCFSFLTMSGSRNQRS